MWPVVYQENFPLCSFTIVIHMYHVYLLLELYTVCICWLYRVTHTTLEQLSCEQPKSTSGHPSVSVSNPQKPSLPMKGELH